VDYGKNVPDLARTVVVSPLFMKPSAFTSERRLVASVAWPERFRVFSVSPALELLLLVSPIRKLAQAVSDYQRKQEYQPLVDATSLRLDKGPCHLTPPSGTNPLRSSKKLSASNDK
jgi:hypothetical protein